MTLTDLNTKYPRLIVPQPFASKTGAAMTPITDGSESTVGNVVNFKDGFPAIYSTPQSGGGKYVGRGDMNALGDLASRNQFRRLCGVINTFDPNFSTKIGGYPQGVILQWLDGNYLRDVISLVDNNTYDFTVNGVDGTNWKLLNPITPDTNTIEIFKGSIGSIGTNNTSAMSVNVFSYKTPRNGVLSCCVQPGDITTVTGITGGGQATLYYKNPTDASYQHGIIWLYGAGAGDGDGDGDGAGAGSITTVGTDLAAGAILTLVIAVSGCKYSSFNVTAKLM